MQQQLLQLRSKTWEELSALESDIKVIQKAKQSADAFVTNPTIEVVEVCVIFYSITSSYSIFYIAKGKSSKQEKRVVNFKYRMYKPRPYC